MESGWPLRHGTHGRDQRRGGHRNEGWNEPPQREVGSRWIGQVDSKDRRRELGGHEHGAASYGSAARTRSRSPFVESLETLAELQADGKIQEIGLCNVGPLEMEQANRYFRLASVQNELSVVSRAAASDGSLALAERLNIPFFAYRPLGGHAKVSKLASNRTLAPLAKKHGVTPEQVAIAVLCDLGSPVIPLFGASRRASLIATLQALRLKLDDEDREWIRGKVSFEASEESRLQWEMMKPRSLPSSQHGSRVQVLAIHRKSFC